MITVHLTHPHTQLHTSYVLFLPIMVTTMQWGCKHLLLTHFWYSDFPTIICYNMKCPLSKGESLVVVYIIPSKHPLSKCGCPMVCIITFHNRSHPCANPQEQLLQRYYNNTVLCSDHHPPAQSMLQALFPSIVSVGETLCNSVSSSLQQVCVLLQTKHIQHYMPIICR